jgi:hypothetical protein
MVIFLLYFASFSFSRINGSVYLELVYKCSMIKEMRAITKKQRRSFYE